MAQTPQSSSAAQKAANAEASDRRKAPRLEPHQVPWIREVKPATGDSARLLNISSSGVLLETTTKLKPGRRSALIIVGDLDERERAEVDVIRTELISIGSAGQLVYRTALAFTEEIDLRGALSQTPLEPQSSQPVSHEPCVEGPLEGLWYSKAGSRPVRLTRLFQAGCDVHGAGPVMAGDQINLTTIFTPVRSLTLAASVADVSDGGVCRVTFVDVHPEAGRLLRVEIRELMAAGDRPVSAHPASPGHLTSPDRPDWLAHAGTLHVNQW